MYMNFKTQSKLAYGVRSQEGPGPWGWWGIATGKSRFRMTSWLVIWVLAKLD